MSGEQARADMRTSLRRRTHNKSLELRSAFSYESVRSLGCLRSIDWVLALTMDARALSGDFPKLFTIAPGFQVGACKSIQEHEPTQLKMARAAHSISDRHDGIRVHLKRQSRVSRSGATSACAALFPELRQPYCEFIRNTVQQSPYVIEEVSSGMAFPQ